MLKLALRASSTFSCRIALVICVRFSVGGATVADVAAFPVVDADPALASPALVSVAAFVSVVDFVSVADLVPLVSVRSCAAVPALSEGAAAGLSCAVVAGFTVGAVFWSDAAYRIALDVRGSDFAREIGEDGSPHRGSGPWLHDDPFDRPAVAFHRTTTLHTGAEHGSYLLLPVVPDR
jgi:hypothetical protein